MVGLKIVWTETATIILQQILTFYRVRNGNSQYSRSIYRMINDVLKLVTKYPYMYKATSVPNVRVFHCEYFRVYYRVLDEYILVEAVFDTRQDPGKAPF
ncbi:type II toxin-antitoxin system RelE/ParE family toxin [Bacteroides sp.]|uniref:type II toxin-antitoxin system RelE/ParE family toxin n=1 Tax=Bacteroides sp. TaxID=29523 RepID=UPI0025C18A84|nr:type II toxin-antitoxin system RelE/ParE family toxin [Bacteroides sp.]